MNQNEKTETLLDSDNQVVNTVPNPVPSAPVAPSVAPNPVPSAPVTPSVAPSPVPSAPVTPSVAPSPVPSAPVTPSVAPNPVPSAPVAPSVAPNPVPSAPVTPSVAPNPAPSAPVTPSVAPSPVPSAPVTPSVAPSPVPSAPVVENSTSDNSNNGELNLTPMSTSIDSSLDVSNSAGIDVTPQVESDSDNHPELENTVITSAPITPEAIEDAVTNASSASASTTAVATSQSENTSQPAVGSSTPDVAHTIASPNEVMAATVGASTEGTTTTPAIDLNGGNFENTNEKLEPPKKGGIGKIIGLVLIIAILGAVIIFLPDIQSFIIRQSNPIESEPTATPTATPTVTNTVLTCTLTTDDEMTGLHHVLTETYSGQSEKLANIEIEEVITPSENTMLDYASTLENETSACLLEMEKYPATSGVVVACDTTVSNSLTRSFMYDLEQIKEYNASLTTPTTTPTPTATVTPSATPTETQETVTQSPVQLEYSLGESIASIATAKQTAGYTCTTE